MSKIFGFEKVRPEMEVFYRRPRWDNVNETPKMLVEACREIDAEIPSKPLAKARMIAYVLDHAQVDVRPYGYFADKPNHGNAVTGVRDTWIERAKAAHKEEFARTDPGDRHGAYSGDWDFSHTCPDWEEYLRLGFIGILNDLKKRKQTADEAHTPYYHGGIIVYEAMIRYCRRLAQMAEQQPGVQAKTMADNLRAIADHAPRTLYQALQLVLIVYWVQTEVEGVNVRSLGRMDTVYYDLYRRDLDSGVMNKDEIAELLRFFFCRLMAAEVGANIPFTLCGYGKDGKEVTNDFTRLILDVYAPLGYISPKIQIRWNPATPDDVMKKTMDMIRHGVNSLVYCNDEVIVKALEASGDSHEDALNYVLIGCYEPASMANEIDRTCTGKVSMAKAVELAMNGGRDMNTGELIGLDEGTDFASYEEFSAACYRQLGCLIDRAMDRVLVWESAYADINPSPLFSPAMPHSRESGVDAYEGGTVYDHSSINPFAVATAVDAMLAVKQVVFDEGKMTVAAFADILKNNWDGNESLRQYCLRKVPKYGNHGKAADTLGKELYHFCAQRINGKPNGLGGTFRMGGFSIDWRYPYGERSAASADGRLSGEPLSKNMSATLSMDKNGVTALVQSAGVIDYTEMPNGTALDLLVHPSAVAGEDGLLAGIGIVTTFFAAGGIALQMNVLDAAVLRRAQKEPKKYANLQVRVCGWNVLFVDLSKQEQDDFIRQAEAN